MKSSVLLLFTLFISLTALAQPSVKIRKNKSELYRGVESRIDNWYIYKNEGEFYLCPLNIVESEVEQWFQKRMNSQNIYKGRVTAGQYTLLVFRKENDVMDLIKFYYKKVDDHLELISTVDGVLYTFDVVGN